MLRRAGIVLFAAACVSLASCVRFSGGEWYIKSAATPEGWPELTPVGEVEVKDYPAYRAAEVRDADLDRDGIRPMFNELFGHIKRNDIAMTAPVDMGYDEDNSRMASMAFLYRTGNLGATGDDGPVLVRDLEPARFASVGVRGSYTERNFRRGLSKLNEWLETNPAWLTTGPPRYLGYNGPFVPWFARYGEVQVPVEQASD